MTAKEMDQILAEGEPFRLYLDDGSEIDVPRPKRQMLPPVSFKIRRTLMVWHGGGFDPIPLKTIAKAIPLSKLAGAVS